MMTLMLMFTTEPIAEASDELLEPIENDEDFLFLAAPFAVVVRWLELKESRRHDVSSLCDARV